MTQPKPESPSTRVFKPVKGNEWSIISLYLEGKSTKEIGSILDIRTAQVTKFMDETCKALFRIYETNKLLESQARDSRGNMYSWSPMKVFNSEINKKFVSLLSEPDDPILTNEERTFCYLMVHDGDEKEALKESGLMIGLSKASKGELERLVNLRCTYLKAKPNLTTYMRDLQLDYVKQIKVSKETIQGEILKTLGKLRAKDAVKSAPTIAKLLNDLGRTEGVFIDKTEIDNKVSLDDSFEMMMERRKELHQEAISEAELEGSVVECEVIESRRLDIETKEIEWDEENGDTEE